MPNHAATTKHNFPYSQTYLDCSLFPHAQGFFRPTGYDANFPYPSVKVKDKSKKVLESFRLPELILFDLDSTIVGIAMFEAFLAARVAKRFDKNVDIENRTKRYHENKNYKGIDSWTQSIQDIIFNNSINDIAVIFNQHGSALSLTERAIIKRFKDSGALINAISDNSYMKKEELCSDSSLSKELDRKFRSMFFAEEQLAEVKLMQNQLLIDKNLLQLFSRLMRLTGRQTGIVTSRRHDDAIECLLNNQIDTCFDCITGSVDGLNSKPAADLYIELFKRLGYETAPEFIMVGDSETDFHIKPSAGTRKFKIIPIATSDPTDFYNTDLQHHQVNGHNAKFSFRWTNRFLKLACAIALSEIKGDTSREEILKTFKHMREDYKLSFA